VRPRDAETTRPDHRLFQQPWPEGEFRFFQLGFLVEDVPSAAAAWARVFGVGPFLVRPASETQATYRGRPAPLTMQVAVAQAGPVQIELIGQYCDRPSVFREWLGGRTSALHQLCTVTPDFEGRKEHYERLGYELAGEIDTGSWRLAYFDTSADFGFYTEVLEQSPESLAQLAGLARLCAKWDGTDPIRLLTPDGYEVP
jgi:hypothetical protein